MLKLENKQRKKQKCLCEEKVKKTKTNKKRFLPHKLRTHPKCFSNEKNRPHPQPQQQSMSIYGSIHRQVTTYYDNTGYGGIPLKNLSLSLSLSLSLFFTNTRMCTHILSLSLSLSLSLLLPPLHPFL